MCALALFHGMLLQRKRYGVGNLPGTKSGEGSAMQGGGWSGRRWGVRGMGVRGVHSRRREPPPRPPRRPSPNRPQFPRTPQALAGPWNIPSPPGICCVPPRRRPTTWTPAPRHARTGWCAGWRGPSPLSRLWETVASLLCRFHGRRCRFGGQGEAVRGYHRATTRRKHSNHTCTPLPTSPSHPPYKIAMPHIPASRTL